MKLLMITGLGSARDLVSGKKGAFYNTLEEFHKYWERVDIICPRVKSEKRKVQSLFGNVFLHLSPWPLFLHPFWFLKKGLEIYKEQKFDLMTVHEFPPFYNGIGARLLWQKTKVPYILEIFHIPGHPKSTSIKEIMYKFLFRMFIGFDASKTKAVRVMNKKQVSDFLLKSGVPTDKIMYIPAIYIDMDIFKLMDLPKEYDLIFVGRLEQNKGIDLLIDSIQILKIQNSKFKILIVGDGPLRKNLESRISNLDLGNNVVLCGWAKDSHEIASLLNKSKILVMTSYNEGGPRVVFEAMACGVPVLATSVGIVPDVMRDGESGRIINWNAEDIAVKAKELLLNTEEYNKYRQAGLEIVKQFEKKTAIKNYAENLQALI